MSDRIDKIFRPISPAPNSDEDIVPDNNNGLRSENDPSYSNRRMILPGQLATEPNAPRTPECEEVAAINELPVAIARRINTPEIRRPTPLRVQRSPEPEGAVGGQEIGSPVKVDCVIKSLEGEGTAFKGSALERDMKNLQVMTINVGNPPDAFRTPGGEKCNGACTGNRGPCAGSCTITSVREVVRERYSDPLTLDEASMVIPTSEISSRLTGSESNRPFGSITDAGEETCSSAVSSTDKDKQSGEIGMRTDSGNQPPDSSSEGTLPQSRTAPAPNEGSAVGVTAIKVLSTGVQCSDVSSSRSPAESDSQPSCSGITNRNFTVPESYPPVRDGNEHSEATGDDGTVQGIPPAGKENKNKKKPKAQPQRKPPGSCGLQEACRKGLPDDEDDDQHGPKGRGGRGKGSMKQSPR